MLQSGDWQEALELLLLLLLAPSPSEDTPARPSLSKSMGLRDGALKVRGLPSDQDRAPAGALTGEAARAGGGINRRGVSPGRLRVDSLRVDSWALSG
mmetsp:Transcript_55778/g.163048  ORF Transcript_55778/g.163048 Transcript_55778/m.163048 type:complete len:97 (+) Transcript_55778:1796-2086(+)